MMPLPSGKTRAVSYFQIHPEAENLLHHSTPPKSFFGRFTSFPKSFLFITATFAHTSTIASSHNWCTAVSEASENPAHRATCLGKNSSFDLKTEIGFYPLQF